MWVVEPLIAVPVHGFLRHFIHGVWWRHVNSHDPRLKVPVMQLGSVCRSDIWRIIRVKRREFVVRMFHASISAGFFYKSRAGDVTEMYWMLICQRFLLLWPDVWWFGGIPGSWYMFFTHEFLLEWKIRFYIHTK